MYLTLTGIDMLGRQSDKNAQLFQEYAQENYKSFLDNYPVPTSFLLFLWEEIREKEGMGSNQQSYKDLCRNSLCRWHSLPLNNQTVGCMLK